MEDDTFLQWLAENVCHNLVTLTDKGIFDGMGVVSANYSKWYKMFLRNT